MTTLAPPPAVTSYANAVRQHLARLDAETLDELTGGLEADLAEALTDRLPDGGAADLAAVTSIFGSPAAYAEELRSAAGVELPAAGGASSRPGVGDVLRRAGADAVAAWSVLRQRHPWLRSTSDFLVSLRPAWWLLRGWILFHLVTGLRNPFFGSGLDLLLLVSFVVLSVLWGQQRIGQRRWWRRLGLAATAVTIVAALPILIGAYNRTTQSGWSDTSYQYGFDDGQHAAAQAGGVPGDLTNLFVYGPDGQPIENAQIVDQDGDPVILTNPWTSTSWASWETWDWYGDPVPSAALEDRALNVYPWAYIPSEDLDWGEEGVLRTSTDAPDPRWPAAALFPVTTEDDGEPSEDASASASEAPSEEAGETPSETASEAGTEEPTGSPSKEASTTPTAEATEPT